MEALLMQHLGIRPHVPPTPRTPPSPVTERSGPQSDDHPELEPHERMYKRKKIEKKTWNVMYGKTRSKLQGYKLKIVYGQVHRVAPLVSGEDGEVVDVFSAKDVERIRGFPKLGLPSLGADGYFMVGATMGTRFVLAF
ncbi:hypothetical protein Syun_016549 [Stephania yunnanensis]|uniref:Uncharacterized protein n=1 Tax=Stephania yunnanensis TaxID=152371 RepID=A0AAP0J521_9MAGN